MLEWRLEEPLIGEESGVDSRAMIERGYTVASLSFLSGSMLPLVEHTSPTRRSGGFVLAGSFHAFRRAIVAVAKNTRDHHKGDAA